MREEEKKEGEKEARNSRLDRCAESRASVAIQSPETLVNRHRQSCRITM